MRLSDEFAILGAKPAFALPLTERLAERVLVLPTGPALDESDVERVVDVIRRAVASGPDLVRVLRNAAA